MKRAKKIIAGVIWAILLANIMTMPGMAAVSGAITDIRKGTPVIDGKIDEMYTYSMCLVADYAWFGVDDPDNADYKGTAWFLWDDGFLYAFVRVELGDISQADEDYFQTDGWPWMNNNIEFMMNHDDTGTGSILVDAYLTRVVGAIFPDREGFEVQGGIVSGTEYVMEYKIPLEDPEQGDKMSIYFQIDRLFSDGEMSAASSFSGRPEVQQMDDFYFGGPVEVPVAAEEPTVVIEEDEPVVDVADTPQPAEQVQSPAEQVQSPAAPAPSPSTGDNGIIAVILLFAAAGTTAVAVGNRRGVKVEQ